MTRTRKIFLGILTCLPFVFFVMYLVMFASIFFRGLGFWNHHLDRIDQEDFFFNMIPAFIFLGLLIVSKLALLIYYIVHAVNNKKLDSTERIVWILVFLFVGLIGYPIYWYMRIWKDEEVLPPPVMA